MSPPPLGFDPQTVQPVASRFADYVISTLFPDSFFTRHYLICEADREPLNILITTHCVANMQNDGIKEVAALPPLATPCKKNSIAVTLAQKKFQIGALLTPRI
jgi:hypothetical protein